MKTCIANRTQVVVYFGTRCGATMPCFRRPTVLYILLVESGVSVVRFVVVVVSFICKYVKFKLKLRSR